MSLIYRVTLTLAKEDEHSIGPEVIETIMLLQSVDKREAESGFNDVVERFSEKQIAELKDVELKNIIKNIIRGQLN